MSVSLNGSDQDLEIDTEFYLTSSLNHNEMRTVDFGSEYSTMGSEKAIHHTTKSLSEEDDDAVTERTSLLGPSPSPSASPRPPRVPGGVPPLQTAPGSLGGPPIGQNGRRASALKKKPKTDPNAPSNSGKSQGGGGDTEVKPLKTVRWGTADVVYVVPVTPVQKDVMHSRMRYYNRLEPDGHMAGVLRAPRHIFTEIAALNLYNPDPVAKQSSVVTIFSLWNTMFGCGALVIPWGFSNAGLLSGILITAAMASVALYTASLVVKNSKGYSDFGDVCSERLGPLGYYLASGSSVAILAMVCMVYLAMMSDFVDSVACSASAWAEHTSPLATQDCLWNSMYTPLMIAILLFPLIMLRKADILVKFNAFGVVSIVYMLFFIFWKTLGPGSSLRTEAVVEFCRESYFLMGIMVVSYFIHNCAVPMMQNQADPSKNMRDLVIAFVLVFLTYSIIGVLTLLAYGVGSNTPQNFLDLFSATDPFAFAARAMFIVQLTTLIPLLAHICRSQFFGAFFGSAYPGFSKAMIANVLLVTAMILVATFLPEIGTVIRFGGPLCGLNYVFILPIAVEHKMIAARHERPSPILYLFHGLVILIGVGGFAIQFFPSEGSCAADE